MFQLILTVFSIGLFAAMAVATVNYSPAWVSTAKDTQRVVDAGTQALERAFNLYAKSNGDTVPVPDGAYVDGGLGTYFSNYLSFLPAAPAGYVWKYGYTPEATLLADGYIGNASGGLQYFCLYPLSGGSSEGFYRGIRKVQQLFPETQAFVNTGGGAACGRPLNSAPSGYPSATILTLFVRYVPGQL